MLPQILCGPILRRTEPSRVSVWLALSHSAQQLSGHIYRAEDLDHPIGSSTQSSFAFGKHLHVALLTIEPEEKDAFPEDEILCYDILIEGQSIIEDHLRQALVYPPYSLPSFFIQSKDLPLNLLFGSCRKIHGPDEDCLPRGDDQIAAYTEDVNKRPTALFLGGDQIYADDVSSVIMPSILNLAEQILGGKEHLDIPEQENKYRFGSRGYVMKSLELEKLGHSADNHLMGFGEFVSLYCLSWNPDVWPQDIFELAEAQGDQGEAFVCKGEKQKSKVVRDRQKRHREEISLVRSFKKGLPAVRRLLANVPVYMIFDDHEITDDWNISFEWREKMYAHPTGNRLLANGMAAYWLFQAWGNDPVVFRQSYLQDMQAYTKSLTSGQAFTHQQLKEFYGSRVIGFSRWDFMTPTHPRALFLDTRTKRYFELIDLTTEKVISLEKLKAIIAGGVNKTLNQLLRLSNLMISGNEEILLKQMPARLIKNSHFGRLRDRYRSELHQQTFFLVTATPVFGLQRLEEAMRLGNKVLNMYQWDNESWAANYEGYFRLLEFLARDLAGNHCIILSGDVHYGFASQCTIHFEGGRKELPPLHLTQITSSSLKNNVKDLLSFLRGGLQWLEGEMEKQKQLDEPSEIAPTETTEWIEDRNYFPFQRGEHTNEKLVLENNLGYLRMEHGKLSFRFLFQDATDGHYMSDVLSLDIGEAGSEIDPSV